MIQTFWSSGSMPLLTKKHLDNDVTENRRSIVLRNLQVLAFPLKKMSRGLQCFEAVQAISELVAKDLLASENLVEVGEIVRHFVVISGDLFRGLVELSRYNV